ncbi:ribosome maturation factor RimP [Thermosulfurimonas sp.]|uniref:ribosome maturation factor RimP n=1 Tax=Thermosulfurimonas sp. TaxID=2080236 RepID=UPI0026000C88|nr:ribosome maturation factor RimP [Thermosulfurimonas sp.]
MGRSAHFFVMEREKLIQEVWDLAEPVVLARGMELVEVEWQRERRGWVLRLYIDKPGGVTLGDCVRISEVVGDLLDARDLIHHSYHLEVSSPGLERPLRKKEDFERFAGDRVRIELREPLSGRKSFTGTLKGLSGESVVLEVAEGEVLIPYQAIKKARLKPENIF